jgi:hypothetical protein
MYSLYLYFFFFTFFQVPIIVAINKIDSHMADVVSYELLLLIFINFFYMIFYLFIY